jgi:biotin carboxyl carrier protein
MTLRPIESTRRFATVTSNRRHLPATSERTHSKSSKVYILLSCATRVGLFWLLLLALDARAQPPGPGSRKPSDQKPESIAPHQEPEPHIGIARIQLAQGSPHLSPFPARITRVHVQVGQNVEKGNPLFTLTRLDPGNDFASFTVRSNIKGVVNLLNVVAGAEVTGLAQLAVVVPSGMYAGSFLISDRERNKVSIGRSIRLELLETEQSSNPENQNPIRDPHHANGPNEAKKDTSLHARITEIASDPIPGSGLFTVQFELASGAHEVGADDQAQQWIGQLVTVSLASERGPQ